MIEAGAHLKPKRPKVRTRKKGRHLAGWVAPAHLAVMPESAHTPSGARADRPGRHTHRRKRKFPVWPIIVVLIGVAAFAGWKLVSALLQYDRDRAAYASIASMAVTDAAPVQSGAAVQNGAVVETLSAKALPVKVDWQTLEAVSPDIVAWLYCPDTIINYPVVQTSDNVTYLRSDFNGKYSGAGCLFADTDAVLGTTQSNFVVYGHNRKDGSMFGTLTEYKEKDYYNEHPSLFLLTPEQNYRVELLCCRIVEANDKNYPSYFQTTSDYQTYLNGLSTGAYWLNTEYMTTDYQLITLSTCAYTVGFANPRLIVQGVLVPMI